MVFNLYDTSKKQYLGTFTNANRNFELDEFVPITSEEKGIIMFKDSYGNTLKYSGNNQFNFIDTYNNSFTNNGDVYYNPSLLEKNQKRLQSRIDRYKKLKLLGAPEIVLKDAKESVHNSRCSIAKILGDDKILLEDIDLLTSDCNEADLEEMLGIILDMEEATKNIFEQGVGYEEH